MYCPKCGTPLEHDHFCPKCGFDALKHNNQKFEVDYCPCCGTRIDSFVSACPNCGYELKGVGPNISYLEFVQKYGKECSVLDRLSLVRTFPIPNTKEDIVEFAIMASTNIRENAYQNDEFYYGIHLYELDEAWLSKLEQAFYKSQLLFPDSQEAEKIKQLFFVKRNTLEASKAKETKRKKKLSKKALTAIIVCSCILLAGGGVGMGIGINYSVKTQNLERIQANVNELITAGNYDDALEKALTIEAPFEFSAGDKQKWNEKKEKLIDEIYVKSGMIEYKAKIPKTDFTNQHWSDAERAFTSAGFTNVTATGLADLVAVIDYLKDKSQDGKVVNITIDGILEYPKDGYANKDAAVVIHHHSYY